MPAEPNLRQHGTGCTLTLPLAAQAIQDLSPKIVIPMHHRTPGVAEVQPHLRLNITYGSLPPEQKVILPTARNPAKSKTSPPPTIR